MATAAYYRWVNAGRPWKLARPIADMQAYARAHGIAVLGTIGNGDHLTASVPEDHTPFSSTAWPDPLPGYIVTAIDLADSQGLGAAILRDARAGRTPWLKYMNFDHKQYSHSDGFRTSRWNPDDHIHLSIRTDHLDTSLAGYDPLGDDDMPTPQEVAKATWTWDPNKDDAGGVYNIPGRADSDTNKTVTPAWALREGWREARDGTLETRAVRREQAAGFAAVMAKLAGQDVVTAVTRALDDAAVRERAERTAEQQQLAAGLGEALRAELADGVEADVLESAVARALRLVLGSVDE